MQDTSWLVEMRGQGYLTVGDKPAWGFCWTGEPKKALRFTSQEQAESAMESIRHFVPALFPDCLLIPPSPVEHVWSAEAPRKPQDETRVIPREMPDRPVQPTGTQGKAILAPKSNILVNAGSDFSGPLVEEVEVEVETGTGDNVHLETLRRMQLEGNVVSVSKIEKTKKKSDFIAIVIAGLPSEPEHKTVTPHAQFHCFHKSLFEALQSAKPGKSRIVFQYKTTTVANDPKKLIWQNVEDICSVDGVVFQDGKPVEAAK